MGRKEAAAANEEGQYKTGRKRKRCSIERAGPLYLGEPRRSARIFQKQIQTSSETSQRNSRISIEKEICPVFKEENIADGLGDEVQGFENPRGYDNSNINEKNRMGMGMYVPVFGGRRCEGWSEVQDLALHNAYFKVKIGARFWKDVAKLVPGKSSKECFDRFYSAYPTPRVSRSHSRSNGKLCGSPARPFNNAQTLLKPAGSCGTRFCSNQRKNLQAHKTVRWILGRHKTADKGFETDLFSSVEAANLSIQRAVLPTTDTLTSPDFSSKPIGNPNHTETPHRTKSLPRFPSCLCLQLQKQLVSPEVLKELKDPVQHDKYIDMLHSREAARKKAWDQNAKVQASRIVTEFPKLPQAESFHAAKAYMVAGAQQILTQSQTCISSGNCNDEREEEDEDYATDDEIIE